MNSLSKCFVTLLCVILALGCEKQKKTSVTEPVSQSVTHSKDSEKGGNSVAEKQDAKGLPTEGDACIKDKNCEGYLRCITKKCTIPPAITGKHDENTPEVVFRADKGSESDEVSRFYVELARDNDERSRGLMYRRSMKKEWGMLFIYPYDRPLSFWMKNTYIPLDMVFINAAGLVVGVVENAEPLTQSSRTVNKPARYVLELGSGVAREMGVVEGVYMDLLKPEDESQKPLP